MQTLPMIKAARPDPFAPSAIRLRQATHAQFHSLIGEMSAIVRIESGTKRLTSAETQIEAPEGTLVLMPGGVPFDVENHPGADGFYRATGLLIPDGLENIPYGASTAPHSGDARALAAFDRALDLIRVASTPATIRANLVREVLLWLDAAGLRLPKPTEPSVAERVRQVTIGDLAKDWHASEIAETLAMSEATLRRRLKAEATSLSALLTDQRMSRALSLLQATDTPVGVIAGDVGYASPSRFTARFVQRFGLLPSLIRERPGTAIDRSGTVARAAAE